MNRRDRLARFVIMPFDSLLRFEVKEIGHPYTDIVPNTVMSELYAANTEASGRPMLRGTDFDPAETGSTDMGNVSYEVPSIPQCSPSTPSRWRHNTSRPGYAWLIQPMPIVPNALAATRPSGATGRHHIRKASTAAPHVSKDSVVRTTTLCDRRSRWSAAEASESAGPRREVLPAEIRDWLSSVSGESGSSSRWGSSPTTCRNRSTCPPEQR